MEKSKVRKYLKDYGARLRKMRLAAKLTQIKVAQLVGISQATVSHIECGFFLPSDELESALLDIYTNK